jgi:two-component system, NarL family, response regulator NreC
MRIIVADDHQLVREGFTAILEKAGFTVVGQAADGHEALKLARTLNPDIALLDLSMPLLNGLDAAREIRSLSPDIKTILLTMYPDKSYVLQALKVGAKGYVLKNQASEDLVRAIREVANGEVYLSPGVAASVVDAYLDRTEASADPLTPRERQILQLVAEGSTTKEVAKFLSISFKTAETHRNHIMKKLDIHDVVGLVHYAIHRGLVQVDLPDDYWTANNRAGTPHLAES